MSTSLPSARALMTHADDHRHIVFATWVVPDFFPYMRNQLNELTKHSALKNLARHLMDTVLAQPRNVSCDCLKITEKLRTDFKTYGEKSMSIENNEAWIAVSVAMIYFILVTDFHFAAPMSNQMKANHLAQIRALTFRGPELPAHFLQ